MKPFLNSSLEGQEIEEPVLCVKNLSLLRLDSWHFHVEELMANDESSRYLFFQCLLSMLNGIGNFILWERREATFEAVMGLNFFGLVLIVLSCSRSSGSSVLGRLSDGSGSSSSDEDGTDSCTLPNGNSTLQVRGVAVKVWPTSKESSSRLVRRRSKAAMSGNKRRDYIFYREKMEKSGGLERILFFKRFLFWLCLRNLWCELRM